MYFVYILYSDKCNRHYIAYSKDLQARLDRHNLGNHWTIITTKGAGKSYVEHSYYCSDNVHSANGIYRVAEYDINGRLNYKALFVQIAALKMTPTFGLILS